MKKSFCFTLMILFLTACGNRQPQQEETGVSHQTMVTRRSDIALEQSYPASVEGRQSIRIIPRVEGYLADIRIHEGQRVSKGQVLFVLDQATYRADEFLIIRADDVSHIVIRDGVVRLCTLSGDTHTLGMTLDEVESQLNPQRFMRVNRQYIVGASAVDKISTWFQGKLRIYLKGFPDDEIIVSKEKVPAVKRWLDS